jgi:uncharacterized repeat protein (TIGR01451 family)
VRVIIYSVDAPLTAAGLSEVFSDESTSVETLLSQEAVLNNVGVSGDLTGTLNFTDFEIVSINSGSFAGKGFSKGEWQAEFEGVPYKGYWKGFSFFATSEGRIYLKGTISGELSGIVEGYLTESIPESGVYDQYQATWKLNRVGTQSVSEEIELEGTLSYQESLEYPSTELYVLQATMIGTSSGSYTGPLDIVLTYLKIVDESNPYFGEGFSIISYISDFGSGEGWIYNETISPGRAELNGLFASPLLGSLSAILEESESPRTLFVTIERIDHGLPPMPYLKVTKWGPRRVSPGQTIDYVIEYRNDGIEEAQNVAIVDQLPFVASYLASSGGGDYDFASHEASWNLENIPAKTRGYLYVGASLPWGLPDGLLIINAVSMSTQQEETSSGPAYSSSNPGARIDLMKYFCSRLGDALGTSLPCEVDAQRVMEIQAARARAAANTAAYNAEACRMDDDFETAAEWDEVFEYWYEVCDVATDIKDGRFDSVPDRLEQIEQKRPIPTPEICGEDPEPDDDECVSEITTAIDPNMKYGPEGYVTPGQRLDYRVEYENEGEGIAFGVYFTDSLDEDLDDSTLEIGPVVSTINGSVIAPPGIYDAGLY